jgi:hypothetical protein
MSTICMKLDPDIHIGMHLVYFSKTRCDSIYVVPCDLKKREPTVFSDYHYAFGLLYNLMNVRSELQSSFAS